MGRVWKAPFCFSRITTIITLEVLAPIGTEVNKIVVHSPIISCIRCLYKPTHLSSNFVCAFFFFKLVLFSLKFFPWGICKTHINRSNILYKW
jgi:hypothetical protein